MSAVIIESLSEYPSNMPIGSIGGSDCKITVKDFIQCYGSENTNIVYYNEDNTAELVIVNENLCFWTVKKETMLTSQQMRLIFEKLKINIGKIDIEEEDGYTIYPGDLWLLVLIPIFAADPIIDLQNGSLVIIDKKGEMRLFQPSFERNKLNSGYSRTISDVINKEPEVAVAETTAITNPAYQWMHVPKSQLVEIPAGVKSIKANIGALFKLYNNNGSCVGIIVKEGGDISCKIQGYNKPYFIMSTNGIARLYFDSDAVIKFSEDSYPVIHTLSLDYVKRLKPNTLYKIYFDKCHILSYAPNVEMGTHLGHTFIKTDEKGMLPKNTYGATIMLS